MKHYVIGLGEVLFDCLPTGRKLGGAPANFAFHVSQFGFDSCVISAIGDDELGREITGRFDEVGLCYHLPMVNYPTGTVRVMLDANGIPSYDICLGAAWDNIPLTEENLAIARNARAVCFGTLAQRSETSRNTIHTLLNAMPTNALRFFDINLRQHWYSQEVIENSLRLCNILKINDEELDVVAPMLLDTEVFPDRLIASNEQKTTDVCRALISAYAIRIVVLTCGAHGSYVITADEVSHCTTPQVEVADTVGAGDSFSGTFVAQLLRGKSIREAHEKAVAVSAYVCTQQGPMPFLPDWLLND